MSFFIEALLFVNVFPECVTTGYRFTFWGSGGGALFAGRRFGVRNRLHPFATVYSNRKQPFASDRRGTKVAVSMGKATKTGRFQGLTQSCNIVSSGRRRTFCVCESGSRGLKVAVSMGKAAKTCRFQGVMS